MYRWMKRHQTTSLFLFCLVWSISVALFLGFLGMSDFWAKLVAVCSTIVGFLIIANWLEKRRV